MTIDPQTSAYNPRPLIDYIAALKMPYFYEEQGVCTFEGVEMCEHNEKFLSLPVQVSSNRLSLYQRWPLYVVFAQE